MKINNRSELIHNLADIIKETEKQLLPYQMDIYAYLDKETGNVTLDTFTNVGGNSWINDDHYTIYTVKESFDKPIDFMPDIASIAEAVGLGIDDLRRKAAEDLDCDVDDLDDGDVRSYADEHYADKIEAAFLDWYGEETDYTEVAEEAVREFEFDLDDQF